MAPEEKAALDWRADVVSRSRTSRVERLDGGSTGYQRPRTASCVTTGVLVGERRREVRQPFRRARLRADHRRPEDVGQPARAHYQVFVCGRTSVTLTRTRASTATQPSGATITRVEVELGDLGQVLTERGEPVEDVDDGIGVGRGLAAVAAHERARLPVEHELLARRRP